MEKIIDFLNRNSIGDNLMLLLDLFVIISNFILGFVQSDLQSFVIALCFVIIICHKVLIFNYERMVEDIFKKMEEVDDTFSQFNR